MAEANPSTNRTASPDLVDLSSDIRDHRSAAYLLMLEQDVR
jgi:hypothetical protein